MNVQDNKPTDSTTKPLVKVSLALGSEDHEYTCSSNDALLSDALANIKEQCMVTLKDYLLRNNAPADVPDEVQEESSDDDDMEPSKHGHKSKKRK